MINFPAPPKDTTAEDQRKLAEVFRQMAASGFGTFTDGKK